MKTEKYLLIDLVYPEGAPDDDDQAKMKLKVIDGFCRRDYLNIFDVKKDWKPQGGDNLYFFSGCSIPRFKVRDKYSCTIKPSKATAAFIPKNGLEGNNSTFDFYGNTYGIGKGEIRSFMSAVSDNAPIVILFNSIMDNSTIDRVVLTKAFWSKNYKKPFSSSLAISNVCYTNFHNYIKTEQFAEENQIFAINRKGDLPNMTCDVYFENDLLPYLNDGKMVVTAEKYEELRNFGITKNPEDITLMMELMSNMDFDKSIVNLMFLLKEFSTEIGKSKSVDHVNFKSLLTFMDITKYDLKDDKLGLLEMTRFLKRKKQYTRNNLARLSSLFAGSTIEYKSIPDFQPGPVYVGAVENLNKEKETC
jgi:hypothetical protein